MSGFTFISTQDGTYIVCDPMSGMTASGVSLTEAVAELRRLLSVREAA